MAQNTDPFALEERDSGAHVCVADAPEGSGEATSQAQPEPEGLILCEGAETELVFINPETGEIVGIDGMPDPKQTEDLAEIATYFCRRRSDAVAKMVSLQAEMDHRMNLLKAEYETKLKRLDHFVGFLDNNVGYALEPWVKDRLIEVRKKSVVVDGVTFGYSTTRAKTTVVNPELALMFCKANEALAGAVKTTESVLTSMIPAEKLAEFTEDRKEMTGIVFDPGGAPKFFIK